MRVLIGGYVPEEGRASILRTAYAVARHAAPMLDTGEEIHLLDAPDGDFARAATRPKRVKIRKRFLNPARLALCRADVIHLIDNDHAYGIAPWNYRRTVVTCHDLMPYLLDPSLRSVFRGWAGRHFYAKATEALARCAHVVCVSDFTRRTLLEVAGCDENRTSVIPQAVEAHFVPVDRDDEALEAFRRRHGLNGKRVILHVGTCLPYKNIGGLLEIFRSLSTCGGDGVVLLKVGGEFSRNDRAFIARHGLDRRLIHLTEVSEPDLVLAYNAADLLLWPSRFEGFGLPVLEAMACGTPVVCSDGGALPEVAGEAARVRPVDDLEGMAASCASILEDSGMAAALRDAGLARANGYTWEAAARAYCAVYRAVVGGSGP